MIGNSGCWYDEGGDSALSPHTAPALSDNNVVPFRVVSRSGVVNQCGGVKPPWCSDLVWNLSPDHYSDMMRSGCPLFLSGSMFAPLKGIPPRRIVNEKNREKLSCPLCPGEALRRASTTDRTFSQLDRKRFDSCLFLEGQRNIHRGVIPAPLPVPFLLPVNVWPADTPQTP